MTYLKEILFLFYALIIGLLIIAFLLGVLFLMSVPYIEFNWLFSLPVIEHNPNLIPALVTVVASNFAIAMPVSI